jgi:hypothetical protein
MKLIYQEGEDIEVCYCECHTKGEPDIFHSSPCCQLCYAQYINQDGSIDMSVLYPLQRKIFKRTLP